jgi:prepilin-type N-terminal cleavage/methylation domain-containing protein
MKPMKLRAFTLIELLVVIAIIGILSAVVLTSLNVARAKGFDAKIKSDVDSAHSQAELYYSANIQSYTGVCTSNAPDGTLGIQNMVMGASTVDSGNVVCTDTSNHPGTEAWALSAQLMTDTTLFWCTDNTGTSTVRSTQIGTTDVGC